MADSYVCSGARIKCSCGDKISTLTVFPNRTVFLTGKPMANISDHVSLSNIAPFGKCHTVAFPPTGSATSAHHGHLTPMPCVPGTVSEWLNGKSDYIIKGKPALLKSSYCRCKWGGIITITIDGQTDTGHADLSKENIETEEQWNEQQEQLTPEEILDGIQLALDAAGFVPGLGAIPDLLNAAISALRGDWQNAGLSLLAAVPGIGDAAAAVKLANKGTKMAKAAKTAGKATKVTEETVDATKTVVRNTKEIGKSGELSGKELAEHRARQMGIDPKGGGSKTLYDTAPDTPQQPKFLELTSRKKGGLTTPKSDNGFNDLTKGDQFEIQKEQAWDNVKKSQEPSSWNPYTVKESSPSPNPRIESTPAKSHNAPSLDSAIKGNKNNKYDDYKTRPNYSVEKNKGTVGQNMDINI